MAVLGRWTGGTIASLIPTTSWGAPNGLFPTQARNDASTYSWASSTSTLTLPSSDLPDGYMIRTTVETNDSTNGRYNPQGKIVLASGTGNLFAPITSGYSRDNSENRAFIQNVAVIDNPSASATLQFQWRSDTGLPHTDDGTNNSAIEVIPLFYSNIGMYKDTTVGAYSGTTLTQLPFGSTTIESDTAAIEIASNTVTLKGDDKRYLVLGATYGEGYAGRTQRIIAFEKDGVVDHSSKAYMMCRDTTSDQNGCMNWDIIETATANQTLELQIYAGETNTSAVYEGGDEGQGGACDSAEHNLLVIELNDDAEVARAHDSGLTLGSATNVQDLSSSTVVDLNAVVTLDFNDSASFTKSTDTALNTEQAMDALVGSNLFTVRTTTDTTRSTTRTHITVNGTEDAATMHGTYSRGDQSTTGTFAGGSQPGGYIALTSGDDVGLSSIRITGGEAGTPGSMGVSLWAINLDTLEAVVAGPTFNPAWARNGNTLL